MQNEQRKECYLGQTGRKQPTPRQRRRLEKKARQGKG